MKSARKTPTVSARKVRGSTVPADPSSSKRGGKSVTLPRSPEEGLPQWTFLTNHSHVLVLLWRNPSLVLREVALQVGITERAVQRIIADLEAEGFIEREKVGRQNHYHIRINQPLRHPIESHRTIGELLALTNSAVK